MAVDLRLRAAAELELRRRRSRKHGGDPKAYQHYRDILATCPDWHQDIEGDARYRALYGGRGGGKSQYFATRLLARFILNPDTQAVCIREIQHSLTYSAKLLLERKIKELDLSDRFVIQHNKISARGGSGFIIFRGMQDHTAESIKSLEGFDVAWVEEAQSISQYSLDLLLPTIRAPGSEVWFSWNPDQPDDPVDNLFRKATPPNSLVRQVNWDENPLLSQELLDLMESTRANDPDKWAWIWQGGYNLKSDAVVFSGKWRIAELDPTGWDGPYYGADFGFAADPTAVVVAWKAGQQIYISDESYAYGLDTVAIAPRWIGDIPGIESATVRADSARPDTISHLRSHGIPRIVGVEKGKGSVESGVDWLRSHEIIVHPACTNMQDELKRYRYKTNKAGDILSQLEDKDNHLCDSLRYAFAPLIREQESPIDILRRLSG